MENIEAVSAQLGKIAAAFKDGGLFFLIGVAMFLAYLVIMAVLKHRKKSTQEFNFNLGPGQDKPAPQQNGNGSGKLCPAHSGFAARIESIEKSNETARAENSKQHQQLFDGMHAVDRSLAGLTAAMQK